MRRLALAIGLALAVNGSAFAQAPAADEHSAHHPTQGAASASQSLPAKSGQAAQGMPQPTQGSGGAAGGAAAPGMMHGMMQMMQGMQGMMGMMMHRRVQGEQMQMPDTRGMQDCAPMSRGDPTVSEAETMRGMMQMMQGMMQMMQMMQSQMRTGPR